MFIKERVFRERLETGKGEQYLNETTLRKVIKKK